MYKYFVSFSYEGGCGNTEINTTSLITDLRMIRQIETNIAKEQKLKSVLVLNYILLKQYGA